MELCDPCHTMTVGPHMQKRTTIRGLGLVSEREKIERPPTPRPVSTYITALVEYSIVVLKGLIFIIQF